MANREQTYTLKLDAEIGNLTASAEKVKKALSDIGALGKFPELDRGLEMIFKKLDKIKETAAAPIKGSTFTSLGKDAASVGVQLNKLFDTLTELARNTDGAALDILPPDMLQKLRDIDAAMTAYNVTIDNASKKTKELVDAENALSAAEGRLEGWRNKLADATAARNNASDTLAATREELDAAQQRIEATRREVEERRRAIKELEELYEERGADKRKEIVDDKGNTRNLRKERNQLARLENGIPEQQEAISGLEEQIVVSEKAVKSYNDRIAECNRQIGNWTAAVERNRNAVTSLNESFEEGKIAAAKKAYADLRKEAERLGIDISDLPIEGTADDMEELKDRIKALGIEINNMASQSLNSAKQGFEGSEQAVEDFKNGIEDAKDECDQFNESQQKLNSIKENIKQFIGWAGAAKVLSAALRNAFEDIKELDKAMTEIAVVTDFNIGDMWAQLPEYTNRANELGLSITSVYEASALFYQQGLDTNEMVALSNETLKMAKIAGLDAAEATDRMTAALRGFNMELNETSAAKVADVYSELAAITASDVDEISTAMTKTASIASSAGMEFETTAAFLSQIIETTRESAETAGTAMKTVIARFQELKKSPDEIGEVDGEIIDANQIEKALRSVGVSLRDTKGEFRELDDVFLELSSKWNDLDKNTQRYIATIAAGSRQQSRFIAMMQDYDRTQELVTAANNSAGASSEQYAKTMESLETKLTQLDNAWTEFSTGLMNSDFVKAAVDFLTFLLNGINKATEGFEGFTSSLSKVGVLVAVFQTAKNIVSKFFDEVIQKVYISAKKAGENIGKGTKDGLNSSNGSNIAKKPGMIGNMREGFGLVRNNAGNIEKSRKLIATLTEQATKNEQAYNEAIRRASGDKTKLARIEYERSEQLRREQEALVNAENAERTATENTVKGINQMAESAQAAAQALTFVGVGISAIGQAFIDSGAEEAGEVITKIGSSLVTVGTILMGLVPIVKLVSTKIAASGVKAMLPWVWIILILIAVIATVAIVANAIKKASPEYKMEKLAEAADKSTEAAERAEKAYDNLVKGLEDIDKGYDAIKKLTRGTEKWQEAVQDVNSQVLDLIAQYPQLAKYVDNEGGILKIDTESEEVQQVLEEARANKVIAKNSQVMANLEVSKQQNEIAYKNLDNGAKFEQGGALAAGISAGAGAALAGAGIGAAIGTIVPGIGNVVGAIVGGAIGLVAGAVGGIATGMAAQEAAFEDTQTETEKLAKAVASGAIVNTGSGFEVKDSKKLAELNIKEENLQTYYDQVGENTEDLRQFGEQLLATEEQQRAAFSAVAANAMALADTLAMSEQQIAQAGNVVDDVTSQELYNKKMEELGDQDWTKENGSGSMDANQKALRDEAIKAQYGAGARIEGNTVYYRDENNQQGTETLTSDEIKAIIANQYATKESAKLIEETPKTLAAITDAIAGTGENRNDNLANALQVAFEDEEGGNLTKAHLEELSKMSEDSLRSVYDNLTEDQKNTFGTIDNFLAKTQGAANIAAAAFEDAETKAEELGISLKSWMTADIAEGFTTKLDQVLKTTGEAGVQSVMNAYETLIEGKDEAIAAEITALMNGIDWTNQEALLGLQLELEARYGYTTDEAANLTDAMGEAANATSSLAHTVRIFGELYHATQRLNAALEKTENLQWEYDRALKNGADETELSLILEKQRASIENEVRTALEAHELALEASVDAYARGANVRSNLGTTAQELVSYDEKTGTFDLTKLQQYIDAGEFGGEESESYKAVIDYVNELEEANKTAKDHLKTAKSSYEKLEQLQETYDEAYASIYSQVGDALSTILEQELEVQRELLETEQEANDKLIGKIQEDIDERRAERDKEKTEEALSDLSTRLAYLKADSSGANALEIAELEKQLADEQQNYQDSLVDDAISDLEDANEKAAEQRDRQIALAEQQLEIYKKSDAFQGQIKSKLDEYLNSYNTHVKAVRRYEAHQAAHEAWDESTTEKRAQITDAYNAAISGNWDNYIEKYGTVTDEEKTSLLAIGATMNGIENKEVYAQQWAETTEAERQQYQEAYEAIITGKWDNYIEKYGATTDAELVQFASIAASSSTIAEDPGGWNVADTPLGKILQTAGVTAGMDQLEEKQFWTTLGENTSKAANSSELTSENTGGEIGDGSDMRDLLLLIENHTAEAAYYDLKTQQEVSLADSRATAAADTLGFTFRNTADTNETGGYTSGENTKSYIADMEGISNSIAANKSFTDAISTGIETAEAQQKRLKKYGLESSVSGQDAYYNKMSNDDMKTLRGSLATGDATSGLLWANAVNADYQKITTDWRDKNFSKELEDIVEKHHRDGYEGLVENAGSNGLAALRNKYMELTGSSKDEATQAVLNGITTATKNWTYGSIDSDGDDGFSSKENNWNDADKHGQGIGPWGMFGTYDITTTGDMKWKLDGKEYTVEWSFSGTKDKGSLGNFIGEEPQDKWVIAANGNLWAYNQKMSKWLPLKQSSGNGKEYYEAYMEKLRQGRKDYSTPAFETGGLADFTGPAWLDGTKSRPEYVLNANQTERLFQLIDVLDRQGVDATGERSSGDNYFDIDINVESLGSDYDVEQIAAKIRAIIVEDASYRNVNNISLTH